MFKRICIVCAFVFAFLLAFALQATPAQAQDQTYYTYVSEWNVPRGQWAAFEKERDQTNTTLQRLVADGTIIAWGSDAAYVHTEDGYTHEDFFTSTSRAGILKAIDSLRPPATAGAYTSVTKHRDIFLHTLVHGGKTSTGATGYLRVAMYQARPGQGDAFVDHMKKYILPMVDAGVADGSILMYNLDTEDIHSDAPGTYFLAILYSSGDAMDKFFARLAANGKDNPAVGEVISNLTVAEAHRDTLAKVTAYQHK
ncbi:MAG TPA: hypothetical protein VJW93_10690 [Candidatus Acidoferrales bacterium]|nr:hypothetical protein [Candidatus Acidoferrales bacterium]